LPLLGLYVALEPEKDMLDLEEVNEAGEEFVGEEESDGGVEYEGSSEIRLCW